MKKYKVSYGIKYAGSPSAGNYYDDEKTAILYDKSDLYDRVGRLCDLLTARAYDKSVWGFSKDDYSCYYVTSVKPA